MGDVSIGGKVGGVVCIYIWMALVNGHSGGVFAVWEFFLFSFAGVYLSLLTPDASIPFIDFPSCWSRFLAFLLQLKAGLISALVCLRRKQSEASGITDIAD
jgi:hypothetical protein